MVTTAVAASALPPPQLASNTAVDDGFGKKDSGRIDLVSIAPMIDAGFRAVLAEASKRGVLDPPYGRTPMPDSKKIIEDDPFTLGDGGQGNEKEEDEVFVAASTGMESSSAGGIGDDSNDDDDEDKLLEYKFDYGFNPLIFLGEFLHRNNPATIRARKEQRSADLEYIRQRAAKCLAREAALVELHEIVAHHRSSIIHGPMVGDVSDCGGMVWAKAFRPGTPSWG